jgi:predicted membrane channel-forming protein YqfA (hemolysin III family)
MLTKNDIERYFTAEKNDARIFIFIGITSIIIAVLGFLIYKTEAWKGAALSLIVIGLLQFVVGYSTFKRSDDDRIRMVYAYDMNPNEIKSYELPRMNVVNKNFTTYRLLELGLAVTGLMLVFYNSFFALPEYKQVGEFSFSHGLGIALAIQAIILLSTDFFAEKRAAKYTTQIKNYVQALKAAR